MRHGGRIIGFLHGGGFRGLTSVPGVSIVSNRTRFVGGRDLHIRQPRKGLRVRNRGVFVGANTRAIIPPVPKVAAAPNMCSDAKLLGLGRLPKRLNVLNNKCVNIRFTSVFTGFNDGMAVLRTTSLFLPQRSQSVTSGVTAVLHSRNISVVLGTRIRQVDRRRGRIRIRDRRTRLTISTLLVTSNHRPTATSLRPRGTNVTMGRHKTVIISGRLRAATSGV